MRIVLDTNVLVSALIKPANSPGRILDLILIGELTPIFDDRIFAEYKQVLNRPRFDFRSDDIAIVLDYFRSSGLHLSVAPLEITLPDPDDLPFLEVAYTAQAPLISGNRRHFPPEMLKPFKIVLFSPTEFLETWNK